MSSKSVAWLKVLLRPRPWKLAAVLVALVVAGAVFLLAERRNYELVHVGIALTVVTNTVLLLRLRQRLSMANGRIVKFLDRVDGNLASPVATQGVVGRTHPSAPLTRQGSNQLKHDLREIRRCEKALWAGFPTQALRDVRSIILAPDVHPQARATGLFLIARWHLVQHDLELALDYLRAAHDLVGEVQDNSDFHLVYASALTRLGRIQQSEDVLWNRSRTDSSVLLRRFNNAVQDDAGTKRVDTPLQYLNAIYGRAGMASIALKDEQQLLRLDNLHTVALAQSVHNDATVSVIMPVFNSESTVAAAIDSVLRQTWTNLELIIVDDASSDGTLEVLRRYESSDKRVTVVHLDTNGGAYRARNTGIERARGDFITFHDADDWSHAQKIEWQAVAMLEDGLVMATRSCQARVLDDPENGPLQFIDPTLRPRAGWVIPNMSSLMVRSNVVKRLGTWDEVRAGADAEYVRRIRAVYGEASVLDVALEAPLSICRVSPTSLTTDSRTGLLSAYHAAGARRQYRDVTDHWHTSQSFSTHLPLREDQDGRAFPIPSALAGRNAVSPHQDFDVVLMSDFHLTGGTTASNLQEIEALVRAGKRVGLYYHPVYSWVKRRGEVHPINPKYWDVIDGDLVQLLSAGQEVTCKVLVVRYPRVAEVPLDSGVTVHPGKVAVILNQTPFRSYDRDGERVIDLVTADSRLKEAYGAEKVTWYPIGPLVRKTLHTYHAEELAQITMSDIDWVNIIDVDAWHREGPREPDGVIRIGRHSRDDTTKWPETSTMMWAAYPKRKDIEIHVLGGAATVEARYGPLPPSWKVRPFDAVSPRDFLHSLDVYVYFTQTTMVEAFGRAPLEALAAGLPVIVSRDLEPLFGDAAICANPEEVEGIVRRLMSDHRFWEETVSRGRQVVKERFSYEAHLRRIESAQ